MEAKKEKSCGCIIVENEKVLLIEQVNNVWGFPKGHVEENETEVQTALREVKEETNIDVEIDLNKRFQIEYKTDLGNDKEVVYFLARKIGGDIKAQESEINQIKWFNYNDAINQLTYENTRNVLREVIENL